MVAAISAVLAIQQQRMVSCIYFKDCVPLDNCGIQHSRLTSSTVRLASWTFSVNKQQLFEVKFFINNILK